MLVSYNLRTGETISAPYTCYRLSSSSHFRIESHMSCPCVLEPFMLVFLEALVSIPGNQNGISYSTDYIFLSSDLQEDITIVSAWYLCLAGHLASGLQGERIFSILPLPLIFQIGLLPPLPALSRAQNRWKSYLKLFTMLISNELWSIHFCSKGFIKQRM